VKTEILYGFHPVQEALKARRRKIFEIYLAREKFSHRIEKILKLCEEHKITVKKINPKQLSALARVSEHQGIAARVSLYPLENLNDLLQSSHDHNCLLVLMLDQVVDPRNLGALARTALAVGVQAVIVPKDRSASPSPAASKVSAGALEHLRLIRVANLAGAIKQMKQSGIWVVGLDVSAKKSVFENDLTGPLAIVIGAEEKGLRPLAKSMCDFLVSIPQVGPVESLNASVAGAVVMYEAFRQRSCPPVHLINEK